MLLHIVAYLIGCTISYKIFHRWAYPGFLHGTWDNGDTYFCTFISLGSWISVTIGLVLLMYSYLRR